MLRNNIETMVEDIHPRLRRAVERRFQRIDLFVAAVGLDDGQAGGPRPSASVKLPPPRNVERIESKVRI